MKIEIQTAGEYKPHAHQDPLREVLEIDTDAAPTVLTKVHNAVRIRTAEGVEFGVCCRDFGIEVVRVNGEPGGVMVCSIEQSLAEPGDGPEPATIKRVVEYLKKHEGAGYVTVDAAATF